MEAIGVLGVAARQIRALSARQAVVSGNIANVNTPGYRTAEVEAFKDVATGMRLAMTATDPSHFGAGPSSTVQHTPSVRRGSSVDLEREMLKAAEISREHSLGTGLMKSFHRMLLSATRGGS